MVRCSNPGRNKSSSPLAKTLRPVLGLTKPSAQWTPDLFPRGKAAETDVDPHLHLAPRLGKSEAIPPLRIYGFMVWTRTSATGNANHWLNSHVYIARSPSSPEQR